MTDRERDRRESFLRLPADPASPGVARRFVGTVLSDLGHDRLLDSARTGVSELVTNAVLHARTDIEVRVTREGDTVRIGVHDRSRLPPALRAYDRLAATGRGLALVSALARTVGVDADDEGKTTWFELPADGAAARRPRAESRPRPPRAPGSGGHRHTRRAPAAGRAPADRQRSGARPATRGGGLVAGAGPEEQGAPVCLLGMPGALWRATQAHHDEMLRELVLHRFETGATPAGDAALAAAEDAQALLASAVQRAATPDHAAPAGGDGVGTPVSRGSIDVVLHPGTRGAAAFTALRVVLDTAERLSREGQLLTLPALPEVMTLRDWCCDEVVEQLSGRGPRPWHDLASPPDDVVDAAVPGWDGTWVATSTECLVAGDERNRIVAVSRPRRERSAGTRRTSSAGVSSWSCRRRCARRTSPASHVTCPVAPPPWSTATSCCRCCTRRATRCRATSGSCGRCTAGATACGWPGCDLTTDPRAGRRPRGSRWLTVGDAPPRPPRRPGPGARCPPSPVAGGRRPGCGTLPGPSSTTSGSSASRANSGPTRAS